MTFDCRARERTRPSERRRRDASMRTTQVLLNHSTDRASAIRKRGERAVLGDTIDTRSRLPAETIVTLAMSQRRVSGPESVVGKRHLETPQTAAATRTSTWLRRTCTHRVAVQAPHPRRQTRYVTACRQRAKVLADRHRAMNGQAGGTIRRPQRRPTRPTDILRLPSCTRTHMGVRSTD